MTRARALPVCLLLAGLAPAAQAGECVIHCANAGSFPCGDDPSAYASALSTVHDTSCMVTEELDWSGSGESEAGESPCVAAGNAVRYDMPEEIPPGFLEGQHWLMTRPTTLRALQARTFTSDLPGDWYQVLSRLDTIEAQAPAVVALTDRMEAGLTSSSCPRDSEAWDRIMGRIDGVRFTAQWVVAGADRLRSEAEERIAELEADWIDADATSIAARLEAAEEEEARAALLPSYVAALADAPYSEVRTLILSSDDPWVVAPATTRLQKAHSWKDLRTSRRALRTVKRSDALSTEAVQELTTEVDVDIFQVGFIGGVGEPLSDIARSSVTGGLRLRSGPVLGGLEWTRDRWDPEVRDLRFSHVDFVFGGNLMPFRDHLVLRPVLGPIVLFGFGTGREITADGTKTIYPGWVGGYGADGGLLLRLGNLALSPSARLWAMDAVTKSDAHPTTPFTSGALRGWRWSATVSAGAFVW